MREDEILEEIYRHREEYAKSFNYDLQAIVDDLRKKQAVSGRQIISTPLKLTLRTPKMPYIPKDAKWYIAEIVMECRIEGEPRNVVHVNIVLVRADLPEEAFEKAEQLGKESEDSYLNPNHQQVTWIYRGLRHLDVIHDDLEHGAELMFEEKIDVPENEVQDMVTAKSQLNLFRTDKPKDPSRPNYSCKEIVDEVLRRFNIQM